jgi:hypothetical protein
VPWILAHRRRQIDELRGDGGEERGLHRVRVVTEHEFLRGQVGFNFSRDHATTQAERGGDFAEGVGGDGGVATVRVKDGELTEAPSVNLSRDGEQLLAKRFLGDGERAGKAGVLVTFSKRDRRRDVARGIGG